MPNLDPVVKPNGDGVTNLISRIIHDERYDSRMVQRHLLTELKKILFPDIDLTNIVTQRKDDNYWEIFFDMPDENRVALSKMGSGIKTILQTLLNLLILPQIRKIALSDCIFAFEELENNLHPAMQRRLFEYLRDFTVENDITLFLTTHSNIVIDIFGKDPNAQILHIQKKGDDIIINSARSFETNKLILADLDVRASDILQSNGIIWVEGPSDRNFINKWISLIDPSLKEGVHYSVLPYGGRVLSNFSFDYNYLDTELIPLLKINTNSFVIMDKDGKNATDRLNASKKRIQSEIGVNNCWVTEGREIENYLTKSTIEKWLFEKHKISANVTLDVYEKIEQFLKYSVDSLHFNYAENKNSYSREIIEFIELADLDILDLREKIISLVGCIRTWNSLRPNF